MKKILAGIVFIIGGMMFLVGLGAVALYGLVSFNNQSFEINGILFGVALAAVGWIITRYAKRHNKHMSIAYLLDLWWP